MMVSPTTRLTPETSLLRRLITSPVFTDVKNRSDSDCLLALIRVSRTKSATLFPDAVHVPRRFHQTNAKAASAKIHSETAQTSLQPKAP